MKEVEVKAKIENKEEVLNKFKELGCQFTEPVIQRDEIFVPGEINEVPTPVGVRVLRIRESKGKFTFTLKVRLGDELDKMELETEVSDPVATKEIILSLGFKHMVTVVKNRTKAQYKNWEVCIDEVEGLGSFIELEELSEDEGDSDQIQKDLFEFLKGLGVKDDDRVFRGYDVLLYLKEKAV